MTRPPLSPEPPGHSPPSEREASRLRPGSSRPVFAPGALPDPSEADVLIRAQAGDHQAFAHLYSLHKRRIYSLCLRMVGNVAEAEDLTQELKAANIRLLSSLV